MTNYLKCTKCGEEEKVFCGNGSNQPHWTTASILENFIGKHKDCTVPENVAGKMQGIQKYPEACFVLIRKD